MSATPESGVASLPPPHQHQVRQQLPRGAVRHGGGQGGQVGGSGAGLAVLPQEHVITAGAWYGGGSGMITAED